MRCAYRGVSWIFVQCWFHSSVVQPNVQVFGVEGRYAHALFSAASKQKVLENTEKELNDIKV